MAENDETAGGDDTDARKVYWQAKEAKAAQPRGVLLVHPESKVYNMKPPLRGRCIIFNHKVFESHTRQKKRRGTDKDSKRLHEFFDRLNFKVDVFNNYDCRRLLATLEQESRKDHSDEHCFVCCILTHGDQTFLFASDGKYPTEKVFSPFRGAACPSLAGKPKIFLVQACQGDRTDTGVELVNEDCADGAEICKIPNHADFLTFFSTVPGFYAWRNVSEGSWFVQALCRVMEEKAETMDFLQMTTIVNRMVAYDFESYNPNDPTMNNMKQVPCVTSTLTRKIYFSL